MDSMGQCAVFFVARVCGQWVRRVYRGGPSQRITAVVFFAGSRDLDKARDRLWSSLFFARSCA